MKLSHILHFLILTITLTACASKPSRPQLYPNQVAKDRGEKSQQDIDDCLREANDYLKTPEGEKLQESANRGSISTSVGVGFGSASGVGLGVGVGSGGGRSRLSGEEQVRRNYTNQCLMNKGYQVVGWDNG